MHRAWHSGTSTVSSDDDIWKPHVTVAAICERDGRFLLVREEVDGQVVLNQPAGHLDPGESLEQAVIRETLEETAYDFKPQRLTGIYRYVPDASSLQSFLRFAFSGTIGQCHEWPLDEGIIAAEWMSLEEIEKNKHLLRTPMVMQCILDYLQKPAYPLQVFSPDFL